MAFRLFQGKGGGKMKAAILLAFAAFSAHAANFLMVYEPAPGVDFAHLTQQQMGVLQQHGANLTKLREAGVLLTGGRTQNPQHPRGLAIIVAENEAAAKEIGAADPSVRAGVMQVTVEPLDLVFPPTCK
jgi:uncharacterized protein YciI